MLVPRMIRERSPTPASASSCTSRFRRPRSSACCPAASELLEGLLGADLIGFHTASYMRHFASSVLVRAGRGDRRRPRALAAPERAPRRVPDGRRRRATSTRASRSPDAAARRSTPLREAATTCGCWSGSTGSTTRRAFRAGCSRSSGCLREHPELARTGAADPGRGAVARRTSTRTRISARRWTASIGRINGAFAHAELGARSTTSTAAFPRDEIVDAVPGGGRHAGDAAARRHEPGREGVRRQPRATRMACSC